MGQDHQDGGCRLNAAMSKIVKTFEQQHKNLSNSKTKYWVVKSNSLTKMLEDGRQGNVRLTPAQAQDHQCANKAQGEGRHQE